MYPKIAIVGYPPFSQIAREAIREIRFPSWMEYEVTDLPLEFLFQSDMASIENIQSLFEPGTIVISGDRSAKFLEKTISNPVIPVRMTGFDLLEAILQTGTDEVVIVNYRDPIEEVPKISGLLNVRIRQVQFHGRDEAYEVLRRLKEEGVSKVVGGSWVCETAPKIGLTGVFYYSKRSMVRSLQNALNILQAYRSEVEKLALFRTIVDINHSGIIYTEPQAKVKIINKAAEQLLGVKSGKAIGKRMGEIIPSLGDRNVQAIWSDQPQYNLVFEHNQKKLAADIIPIIVDGEHLGHITALVDVANLQEFERRIRKKIMQKPMVASYTFDDIIGSSEAIRETIKQAKKYSRTSSSILIQGESGTGKELFAQSIHQASSRNIHPFVAVNCGALPESLIDSELFGYEEGSFTGARKGGKIGLFELAHQGTIFLDEISELPLHLQSKLLRVLQEKEIVRIGGDQIIPVDVRIIAASNKDLLECVKKGTFREDLYYRISVLQLWIPPLRQRPEDIPLLFRHFLRDHMQLASALTDDMLHILKEHHWPGNVRELENVAERFRVLCQDEKLQRGTIRKLLEQALAPSLKLKDNGGRQGQPVPMDETDRIRQALLAAKGNKTEAARLLGISRSTLWRKLKGL